MTYAGKLSEKEHPVVVLLFKILEAYKQIPDEEHMDACMQLLKSCKDYLGELEKIKLLTDLISLAVNYYNRGILRFEKHIFQLYKWGILEQLIYPKGRIGFAAFFNIATLGAMNHDFDWTYQFIEDYAPSLEEEIRQDTYNLTLGYWYYHKADADKKPQLFDNAIKEIRNISFRKPELNLLVRSLYLKIFFEYEYLIKRNANVLLDWMRNFRNVLSMNKVYNQDKKDQYLNLISFVRKVIHHHSRKGLSDKEKEQIIHEINSTKQLALKAWLIKQIEAL